MNEIITQATALDAKWIITGLGGAFLVFATWVGKFIKQVWLDIKEMHSNQINTLQSVIGKQDESTEVIKDKQDEILTNTIAIQKIAEQTKFSIDDIAKKLDTL